MLRDRRNAVRTALAAGLSLLLSGCLGGGGFEFHRDTSRAISSTTRFEADRFAGKWVIRGEFTHPGEKPLFGAVTFERGADGIVGLRVKNKVGGQERYAARMKSRGRIIVGTPPYGTEYWVLWIDADYRTAAVGTPSGSFGWIIDRKASGGEDRIKAAADIMRFNGYNISRLQTR